MSASALHAGESWPGDLPSPLTPHPIAHRFPPPHHRLPSDTWRRSVPARHGQFPADVPPWRDAACRAGLQPAHRAASDRPLAMRQRLGGSVPGSWLSLKVARSRLAAAVVPWPGNQTAGVAIDQRMDPRFHPSPRGLVSRSGLHPSRSLVCPPVGHIGRQAFGHWDSRWLRSRPAAPRMGAPTTASPPAAGQLPCLPNWPQTAAPRRPNRRLSGNPVASRIHAGPTVTRDGWQNHSRAHGAATPAQTRWNAAPLAIERMVLHLGSLRCGHCRQRLDTLAALRGQRAVQ